MPYAVGEYARGARRGPPKDRRQMRFRGPLLWLLTLLPDFDRENTALLQVKKRSEVLLCE